MSAAVFRSYYRFPQEKEWVGQFQVVRKLGEGGQGHLYEATWEGRLYVLKFFRPEAWLECWGHLELTVLREAKHPQVVRLLGYFRWPDPEQGLLCLVLERIEGQTLAQHVQERNPHALEAARLILRLASTLKDLHADGIVHGDLKPDNIVVRAGVEPVLLDLGSGYMPGLTRVPGHERPATSAFCSPEIWRRLAEEDLNGGSRKPSPSDDVWALGCIFYWLLTNRLPFGLGPDPQVLWATLHETPKAPHASNPRVPVELSALCMSMLEKPLEARCAQAVRVCEVLEPLVTRGQQESTWQVPLEVPGALEHLPTEQIPALELKGYEAELRRLRLARRQRPQRGQPVAATGPELPPPPQAPFLPWSLLPEPDEEQGEHAVEPPPAPTSVAPEVSAPVPPLASEPRAPAVQLHAVPPVAADTPRPRLRRWVSAVLPSTVGMIPVRDVVLDSLRERMPGLALVLLALATARAEDGGPPVRRQQGGAHRAVPHHRRGLPPGPHLRSSRQASGRGVPRRLPADPQGVGADPALHRARGPGGA
jgi:serine/threonine-protein kinase